MKKAVDLYREGSRKLKKAGIDDAEIDAALLLGYLLGLDRAGIFLSELAVAPSLIDTYHDLLSRRLGHEPLAYLVGEQEFWSLPFKVNSDVLIPRSETELLLEMALKKFRDDFPGSSGPVLDMGTGSGVVAVVVARELAGVSVISVDISRRAQLVARENARRHGVADRISFVNGDWLSAFRRQPLFDLVLANPPYVAHESFPSLQPEVVGFEPHLALDGGRKGMEQIRRLLPQVVSCLKPGGCFFMEIGSDHGDLVMEYAHALASFENLLIYDDYAGLPRILHGRCK